MQGDGVLLLQLATMILGAGAVFGGIRAELRAMREDIARLEKEADKAHERIDELAQRGRRHSEQGLV